MNGPMKKQAGKGVPLNGKAMKRLLGFLLKEYKGGVITIAVCLI